MSYFLSMYIFQDGLFAWPEFDKHYNATTAVEGVRRILTIKIQGNVGTICTCLENRNKPIYKQISYLGE